MSGLHGHRGFSLLEVLVAFSIAALALGLIYQVMGNNARQAGGVSERERAMVLAESLVAAYETVPAEGVNAQAESAGFGWQVHSRLYPSQAGDGPNVPRLHELLVSVTWTDGRAPRRFELTSLRPERRPPKGVVR